MSRPNGNIFSSLRELMYSDDITDEDEDDLRKNSCLRFELELMF